MAPDVEQQMQGSAKFGQGVGQQMDQQSKSPVETAVSTCEKILTAVQDETFQTYAKKAIATLKVGLGMAMQKQPQSGMAPPPGPGGPQGPSAGGPPAPPQAGQMPG